MMFNRAELDDIREALFRRVESLDEHLATLDGVIKTLDDGGTVPLFARGVAGVVVAQDMRQGMRVRRARLRALAERIGVDDDVNE